MRHNVSRLARAFALQVVIAMALLPVTSAASIEIRAEPDLTPPIVTSDAQASYVASATITIIATDTASGVDYVSYNLDGAG